MGQKPGELGSISCYLPGALKFYELKDEKLTPLIFVLILAISFGGNYLPGLFGLSGAGFPFFYMVSLFVMQLIYAVYIYAYIKELKGEKYNITDCVKRVSVNIHRIIGAVIIFMVCVLGGLILFFIPGLVLSLMFMFYVCYIVDKDISLTEVFKASKKATDGRKWEIFKILLIFSVVTVLPMTIITILAYSSGSQLVFEFVISFIGAIISLMQQRLLVLMYMDIEYKYCKDLKIQ